MQILSPSQTRYLRLRRQQLHFSHDRVNDDVGRLLRDVCGVQAQEAQAAIMAVRARSTGLTAREVEQARVDKRSIVRTWCMRGTIHLLATEDLIWLLPLLGPMFVRNSRRRYAQLGLSEETCAQAIPFIGDVLGYQGALTRAELTVQLAANGIPAEGQATYHLLRRAGLEGVICFGPERNGEPTYVNMADWLGNEAAQSKTPSFAQLARRYLEAFGPAGPEDLATWSGCSLKDARAGFEKISSELVEVQIIDRPAWMLKMHADRQDNLSLTPALLRLLAAYDPYLLGYQNRELIVRQDYAKRIHPGGGLIRPTLIVEGSAAGTWHRLRRRGHIIIGVELFETLDDELMHSLEQEVQDIGRFLEERAMMEVRLPGYQP